MPLHKNAAISHGNDWVQSDKQPIPWIWDGLVAEDVHLTDFAGLMAQLS